MMPGSKVNKHVVLAHKCLYDLVTRLNMRIKVGRKPHDIRILGRIVGVQSTEQSRGHHVDTIKKKYSSLFSDVMNFADFAALSIKICTCKLA